MDRTNTRDTQGRDPIATIGAGVTITGEVSCATEMQIDGRVNGEVRCGTLFLGEAGTVEGNIQADRVRLSGTIDGTVTAGDLAVEETAQVKGELIYARLKVSAGAIIQGNLRHRAAEEAVPEPKPLKLVEPSEPPAAAAAAAPATPPTPRRVYID